MKLRTKLFLGLGGVLLLSTPLITLASCNGNPNQNKPVDITPNTPAFDASTYTKFNSAITKSKEQFAEIYKDKTKFKAMLEKDLNYWANQNFKLSLNNWTPQTQRREYTLDSEIDTYPMDWNVNNKNDIEYKFNINNINLKDNGFVDIEIQQNLIEKGNIKISDIVYNGQVITTAKLLYENIKIVPIILKSNNEYKLGWTFELLNSNIHQPNATLDHNFPNIPKNTKAFNLLNAHKELSGPSELNKTHNFDNNKIYLFENNTINYRYPSMMNLMISTPSVYLNVNFPLTDAEQNMYQKPTQG